MLPGAGRPKRHVESRRGIANTLIQTGGTPASCVINGTNTESTSEILKQESANQLNVGNETRGLWVHARAGKACNVRIRFQNPNG